MHNTKKEILKCYVRNNNTPLTTTDIVEMVYTQELRRDNSLSQNDKQKDYVVHKAKLHRKILHHINGLIQDDILQVHAVSAKGQKSYVPKLESNQELIVGRTEKIIISSQANPITPILSYQAEDAIEQFQAQSWVQKINAILLECANIPDLEILQKTIINSLHAINDVAGLNDFESIVQNQQLIALRNFIDIIERECNMSKKRLCIIIDFTNITKDDVMYEWFLQFVKQKTKQISVILDATHREMILHKDLLEKIASLFSKYQLKFNIKNDDIHKAPYLIGRAGPYTLSEKEWESYLSKTYAQSFGIALTQSTVIVDFFKLVDKKYSAKKIEQMFIDIVKSLFIANTIQRKNARTILQSLPQSVLEKRVFLSYSHTLIRLKNFIKLLEKSQNNMHLTLLDQIVQRTTEYAQNQEFIYFACGMPLRFKVHLSQSYRHADEQLKVSDEFVSIMLNRTQDIFSPELKKLFQQIEDSRKYVLGIETRIERKSTISEKELIGEILLLMTTYNLPFLCYKFAVTQSEVSLNEYMKKIS
jgi:hypothetical protein